MSAVFPINASEVGGQSDQPDVRTSLRKLHSRRVLRMTTAGMTGALACALAALCAIALIDYGWGIPRLARTILLPLVLFVTLFLLVRNAWNLVRRRTLTDVAVEIEHATGSQRNALVTYLENIEDPRRKNSELYMLARLDRQARVELEMIDESVVAPRDPAIRGFAALGFVLLLLLGLRLAAPAAFAREVRRVLWLTTDDALSGQLDSKSLSSMEGLGAEIAISELRVRVVHPAYSGSTAEEISGDAPVRALAGSLIEAEMHVRGVIDGATLTFNGKNFTMRSLGAGRFSGAFTADTSGAFEARVAADERRAPAPIVRAVEVYNDAQPEARVTEPAKDQLLRSVPDAPVAVRWTARDDLGLAGVALKYIRSRGEGDAAKFTNGVLGAGSLSPSSGREWQGAAVIDLRRLDLRPGDTLVFWIEARDRNPVGNNTGRSASLVIAIAAPELAKLNLGNLMPNEIGRFLLSQRAIIIQTEKLHSERTRLSKEELVRRANNIAAEQREFKNSFNDYITIEGEGEDEAPGSGAAQTLEEQVRAAEDERIAPHFHGIPEPPPGAPTAVKEMTYAIRAMWDAEDALVNASTAQALEYEREALLRLKRAQASVRYVPPIVPQSEPIDLKRRYAGELTEIKTRLEKLARRPQSPAVSSVRAALADSYAALNDLQETLGVPAGFRSAAVARARERAREAADRLIASGGGDHAATIAEAAGQLRIVEMELARLETGGNVDAYATRISKPLALLTQAASNLFAIAESRTRAMNNDANSLLPTDDARAADYFRRLAAGPP